MKQVFFVALLFCVVAQANQPIYNLLVSMLALQKATGTLSPKFNATIASYDFDYQEPKDGYSLLMVACAEGHNDVVATLLTMGANPNSTMQWGNTALHEAVEHGNLECARLLLRKNARVDLPTKDNHTPWHLGMLHERHEMMRVLRQEFPLVERYFLENASLEIQFSRRQRKF